MYELLINCSSTIHFGKNPNRGGSPPNESSSITDKAVCIIFIFAIEVVLRNIVLEELSLSINESEITIYNII